MEVDKVAMKTPNFTPKDPELWFSLLEGCFEAADIKSEKTKFHHATAALDTTTLIEVRDILLLSPGPQPYTRLKEELTKRLSISTERKIRRFLEVEEIGDRTPSQFLRHLRTLGGNVPDEILRTLWTSRLPGSSQAIIAAQKNLPLDDLASVADAVSEAMTAVSIPPPSAPQHYEIMMGKLMTEVAELKLQNGNRQRAYQQSERRPRTRYYADRSSSRQRSSSRSRNPNYCFYHDRFGARAIKCRAPCNFSTSGNAPADR